MSDDGRKSRRNLRLVRTDDPDELRLGTLRVVVAAEDRPPFSVGAIAVEDDTYGVLGADPEFREPTEHPLRIWTELHESEPARPGSVLVKRDDPIRLHAVVHDLSQDPTWNEAWVAEALDEVLRQVERLGLRSLGLPALGSVHGKLAPERFLVLLREAVDRHPPDGLERIWLVVRPGAEGELKVRG